MKNRKPPAPYRWPRSNTMPSVFTAFVRCQQGEETPDADLFRDAWNALQAILCSELKKRGLWQSTPRYLGIDGYERWDAEETIGDPMSQAWCITRANQSALRELVTDCWDFVFSERLQSLKLHLGDKENIDGLVFRSVRNFLFERQREHDPVGFRVFDQVKGAIVTAVSRQTLFVLGGDPRVRNNTVLGFRPDTELRLPPLDLAPIVGRWVDELLPGLVTAKGRDEATLLGRLEELILELPGHGFPCFRVKDLVDPLKNDARQRWATFLAREESAGAVEGTLEQVQVARQVLPDSAVESRQSVELLVRCVEASIERFDTDPRTRAYLASLWAYQHGQIVDEDPGTGAGDPIPEEEGSISNRQLSALLGIPRERIPALQETLRQIVTRCLAEGRAEPPRK